MLDGAAQELLRQGRPRRGLSLKDRERFVESLVSAVVGLAAAALVVAYPPSGSEWAPTAIALTAAFALLYRIKYHLGAVYTVPTELALVPMLLLLPPAIVPALTVAGYVGATIPDYLTGRTRWGRGLLDVGNAAHALGPALVLSVAAVHGPDWSDWPIYLLALSAQFAFDFIPAGVRAWGAGSRLAPQLAAFGWICLVDAVLAPIGLLAAFASADQPYVFLLVLPFAWMFSLFTRERDAHIEKSLELSRAYRGTAQVLAEVLEDTSEYTGSHSRDVVSLTRDVCEAMGLDEHASQEVELTALLHDVGKIAIPPQILDKPGGLSAEEWAVMKTHVVEGQRMLDQVGGALRPVASAVRASHERWDGNGYPDGLVGEKIPFPARVVGCCDALHAMTSDRPYRSAMPVDDALEELRANAGSQFDPQIVEVLAAVARRPEPGEIEPAPPARIVAAVAAAARRKEAEVARPAGVSGREGDFEHPSLFGELEAHAEHIAAVAQATRELARAHDAEEVRDAICKAALRVSGGATAVLIEPVGQGWLAETARAGDSATSSPVVLHEPGLEHPRFVPDIREGGDAGAELGRAVGGASAHLEPVVRDGAFKAVVAVAWREPLQRLPAPVAAMMTLLTAEAAVALERAELLSRLQAAARKDELTGLLKRKAWDEQLMIELARAGRESRPLCVVMFDIDHFKRFNDREGHLAGDELLKDSSRAWRAELRLTDQLGRYGGDEFLALLPGCTLDDGRELVERLGAATAQGQSCSAGIAEWDGEESPEALVGRADEALLAAKQRGRNQIALAV